MTLRQRIQAYLFVGAPRWALPLCLLSGCIQSSPVASESLQSLASFRIAAAHVAIDRPKLPDTLRRKDDESDPPPAVSDDRPLCVIYRPSWLDISDADEIDERFRVRITDKIPREVQERVSRMRLPVVHWDCEGYHIAEYRGADHFNGLWLRVRDEPKPKRESFFDEPIGIPIQRNQPVQGSRPHWTHPGDIFDHLRTTHGASTAGLTREQALDLHDAIHEGRVTIGNCPGGICPVRRRR